MKAGGIVAGFPCQGTSGAGSRRGMEDTRTRLVAFVFQAFDLRGACGTYFLLFQECCQDSIKFCPVSQVIESKGSRQSCHKVFCAAGERSWSSDIQRLLSHGILGAGPQGASIEAGLEKIV